MKLELKNIFFLFSLVLFSSWSHANLLFTPNRVAIDDRERYATLSMINNSDKTMSYEIAIEDKLAKPAGGYAVVENYQYSAKKILRVSPRRVVLAPNGKQTVKILARRPKDLAEGEYRSHLKLTPIIEDEKVASEKGQTTSVAVRLSFSLPVIVKKGKTKVNLDLNDVKIHPTKGQAHGATIVLGVLREGNFGSTGNVIANFTPNGSTAEKVIAQRHGYNIFREVDNAQIYLNWPEYQADSGVLEIQYQGQKEFKDQLLFAKKYNVVDGKISAPLPY
ncbi:hypothetical protein HR060_02200 [Catenovulum sp. SM1970]|uniref:fimbrial biogenesis chaperone n=1 Tax=Marinifaba aquimaris TaxID=2741323 RepID=UPI0015718A56|nr:hypothetical protein [Marinifaba aquimaris]NTS75667.1 hypothetical protein [Marinifaba aquimaris]